MSVTFSESARREFDRLLTRYPDREAVILPALYLAQGEFGYVSDEAIEYIAGLLGVTPSRIEGVATFYTQFRLQPQDIVVAFLQSEQFSKRWEHDYFNPSRQDVTCASANSPTIARRVFRPRRPVALDSLKPIL